MEVLNNMLIQKPFTDSDLLICKKKLERLKFPNEKQKRRLRN